MSSSKINEAYAEKIARARHAALKAYAPYSGFHVGCVVEAADGQRFAGSNMENASYGVSMCAETSALLAASHAVGLDQIRQVVVSGGFLDGARDEINGDDVVTPCGRCRQLILEASQVSGKDIEVVCASGDGKQMLVLPISELLPHGFGPANLADAPVKAEGSSKK